MSTLYIGDLHIDKLNHRIPNFTQLVLKTLKDTVQLGLERGISDVILCGDVFDSSNPTQKTIVSLLKTLSSLDANFHIIMGNHDFSDTSTHSLQIAKWVSTLKSSNIQVITKPTGLTLDDGDKVWLLPHPYVEDLPKKYRLGVGHFAVNGAKSDNGFVVRTKHCPKGEWILGDFHTPQGGRSKSCKFQYVGSLTQLSFSEHEKKRVLLQEEGDISSIKVPKSYVLKKAELKSSEDKLPDVSDSSTYWQIKYVSDYPFPKGWLAEHSNIVHITPITKRKDKRATVLLEKSEFVINPLKPLPNFLRNGKYSETVVNRALELAEGLRK